MGGGDGVATGVVGALPGAAGCEGKSGTGCCGCCGGGGDCCCGCCRCCGGVCTGLGDVSCPGYCPTGICSGPASRERRRLCALSDLPGTPGRAKASSLAAAGWLATSAQLRLRTSPGHLHRVAKCHALGQVSDAGDGTASMLHLPGLLHSPEVQVLNAAPLKSCWQLHLILQRKRSLLLVQGHCLLQQEGQGGQMSSPSCYRHTQSCRAQCPGCRHACSALSSNTDVWDYHRLVKGSSCSAQACCSPRACSTPGIIP
jgi:hypothetical protein